MKFSRVRAKKELSIKRMKNPCIGDGREKAWIKGSRAAHFMALFRFIREKSGLTYDGTRDFVGLSASTLDGLEKGRITVDQGKKIIDCYKRVAAANQNN